MHLFNDLKNRRSFVFLIAGFTLNLVLFASVIFIGLKYLQDSSDRMRSVAYSNNAKLEQIVEMHALARNRSLSLYTMTYLNDPFDRDEEYEHFMTYGGRFIQARTALLAMNLSAEERALVEEQGRLTSIAVPVQREVVRLVQQDKIEQARKVLQERSIPSQNQVLEVLKSLLDLQLEGAKETADRTQIEQKQVKQLILLLGSTAILIGLFIAMLVTRMILRSEKQLSREKELAETTLYSIGDAVIATDTHGVIQSINPVAESLTGWDYPGAVGQHLSSVFNIVNEENGSQARDLVDEALAPQSISEIKQYHKLYNRTGMEYVIEHTASPIRSNDGKVSGVILVFRDVTGMRALTNQLSYQASHDALTGLINRREFEVRLEQVLQVVKSENLFHALLYLDLDQFKVINDTCGHIAGDELLKQLAMNLKLKLRESDVLARLGGDEFGILLEGCSQDRAVKIANALLEEIRDMRFVWDNKSFNIGTSIGLVPISAESGSLTAVLSAADSACYEAKEQGRNRVHVYQMDDADLARRQMEMQWVHRIQEALDQDRVVLYCQDVVALHRHEAGPHHCEILIRIINADGDLTPPMAFIPAAERYNLMPVIDRCVVDKVFEMLVELPDFERESLRLSINISGQSLCDVGFQKYLISRMQKDQSLADVIIFEITETAAIANLSHAMRFINSLKDLGCKFALDDFGSGLSSFSYLKNLPVDYLKIDGTFVRDIVDDPLDHAFVRSITQIGHVMGLKIIAEYVESAAILQKLRDIGVDYAQGYEFGKPRPLQDIRASLRKQASA
jgi:diguanylate cyclase (GGDEF)-like protein/PAS domain S-box-containing protein